MMPVQCTCSARTPEAIADAAAPLLAASLRGFTGSYAIVWRRRCNNELEKMKVIDALAAAVQAVAPAASVDLKDAEAAVVAEVIKTTCSLSVLPRWRQQQGYNLRTVSGGATLPPCASAAGGGGGGGGKQGKRGSTGGGGDAKGGGGGSGGADGTGSNE